ncbi:transglycosylase family protein [Brachybacterium rhamnosum]|uniref:Transglycosylase family protein n=1 Tax=Brachybacterium rhamnosum TaxID=173361 RepID=A0ABW4PZF7_9MICO
MTTSTTERKSFLGRTALTLAGGAVVAAGAFAAAPAQQADAAGGWDQVAQCESSGNWSTNTGNGFYGGLQFTKSTWQGYGGGQYASTADKATKSQQIAVAEKVLAGQGAGAWPNCGKYLTGGADTSSSPSSDSSSSDSDSSKSSDSSSSSSSESRSSESKSDRSTERTSTSSSSEKKSTEKQGDWSCDGDGIADNCTDNGFTKKTGKKSTSSESTSAKKSTSSEKKSTSSEKKSTSSKKSTSESTSSKKSTSSSKSAVGNPDLQVAGTLEVDGKMGPKTITALQDWLGVEQTGELDETTTKALQAWVKTDQDGVIGKDTVKGLEHEVGASHTGSDEVDGSTVKVLQAFLNLY